MSKRFFLLTKSDAEHLYELALEHFQDGCYICIRLKKRLEVFIEKKAVSHIKRVVKKNPYCKQDGLPKKESWKKEKGRAAGCAAGSLLRRPTAQLYDLFACKKSYCNKGTRRKRND